MPVIVLSSTFAQDGPGNSKGYEYSRTDNPTRHALEVCLAALEGGTAGLAFASGLAAETTLLHTLRPGSHVLCGDDIYGGTFRLLDKVMRPLGIEFSQVNLSNLPSFRAALRPTTKLVWVESPTNPMLRICDIAAIASIAREAGAALAVDNTFATPVLQRPLELGATVVVHSTTKYINGHSDAIGGVLVTSDSALAERLRFLQNAIGAVPSPFDCYMILRGVKTLGVRVRQQSSSAQTIAEKLERHPAVAKVYFPGLRSHAGYTLAKQQMRGPGAMISMEIVGGLSAATNFLRRLRIFTCAESLGGVESLAEHPARMTHATIPREAREALGISDGMVRLSVGIEAEPDLWADIDRALAAP
jgi:cystathionine gamma-synthase/cystathionine gamma-lyase